MIMVVIAGLGTAIILGWMGGISAPRTIDAVYSTPSELVLTDPEMDGTYAAINKMLIITVLDQDGEPVQGATVVLDGCNVQTSAGKQPHGITTADGKVTLSGLTASQTGRAVGFITVTVAKSGMGTDSTLTVPVISE
jgi:hypothetical protein